MGYRIAVDTGGTFTDVVVLDPSGRLHIGKALTTPDRIFEGMQGALAVVAEALGMPAEALLAGSGTLIYGTTRATNAVVTRRTAKTAFLTTRGFKDTLTLKEGGKPGPHDYSYDYPDPYIPRRRSFEITERIGAGGEVVLPLDEVQARAVIATLRERGFEAVAVSLLWSIANPAHELRLGALLAEMLPGVPYTLSHQLVPILREYRRASATAIDASLKPLMQRHLREMAADLQAAGFAGDLLVSTSGGGCQAVEDLIARPIHTLKSGPAMAPVAGRAYAALEGLGGNAIVCDTGGTTFDVGLVRDGGLVYTRESWLGGRWLGDIIGTSTVDVRSIGAGGGSIAWVDAGGLLRVGPQSAGSVPGPACYGRGGDQPTVTDAALVLGYIDPAYFNGGRLRLDPAAGERVIAGLAARLGRTPDETAAAVMTIADELMIKAIGEITVNEGVNPRESVVVAGGGAAGFNIMPIARELGCGTVILPRLASALSACGMQHSDIVFEATRSRFTDSAGFDIAGVNRALEEIGAELAAFRAGLRGAVGAGARIKLLVEARYRAQVWELDTPLPAPRLAGPADVAALAEAFHQAHERVYAVRDEGSPVEFVNWKGRIAITLFAPPPPPASPAEPHDPVPDARRSAYFAGVGRAPVPVFRGDGLAPGARIAGPAIIEEPTTTIVVPPGLSAALSAAGNYILRCG
ncbi:hydantoinase/oxoprolinase family protein [Paracraurococcus ruber]|uniref:5-oxoprolinase n=1 Tax=Paracraurococcus ruber TaxID=77675 RepID=A0ABS1CV50_9PROT|nr:hydantoinase/oxoprolinase family protein [Paracraurococcus ruber]MBK1658395.1 5-oxoprolinase [Paracraurococcus ruber]TDG31064.1 hydantoinase/oxoprolinase family protein [Paracraurococcus ruber]